MKSIFKAKIIIIAIYATLLSNFTYAQDDECKVYEVNYDSLDGFIYKVKKHSKEIGLGNVSNLKHQQLKRVFLKDTISKQKLGTNKLYNKLNKEIPAWGLLNKKKDIVNNEVNSVTSFSSFSPYPSLKYIPIKFFMYQNASGNYPATEAEIIDAIRVVNDNFRRNYVSIRFYLECSVVQSSCVGCGNNPSLLTLSAMYLQDGSNHISVHLLHNGTSQATLPWVPLSGSISIGSRASLLNETTLTHELGHSLGLYHTHRGRNFGQSIPLYGLFIEEIDNHNSGNCYQEPVSRSKTQGVGCISTIGDRKCEVNGDELCDTAGSPSLSGTIQPARYNRPTCTYIWDGKDNWGALWNPPGRNYMGYTRQCRNDFTPEQIGRMLSYVPAYRTTSAGYQISFSTPSGSTIICPFSTVTLSIPNSINASAFAWQIPPGWTVLTTGLQVITGEGGWDVYRGATARSIQLRAPSTSQLQSSQMYWIGVNPEGCNIKPADIQLFVGKIQLFNNYTKYCTNGEYVMESSLEANYSLSNPSWQIVSGQGTYFPKIKVGTGACILTATYVCGQSGIFTFGQSASLALTADPYCSGGGDPAIMNTLVQTYYPNPTEDEVFIRLNKSGENQITLTDDHGNIIDQLTIDDDKFVVNLPEKSGTYYIKVHSENKMQTIRILKK